MVVLVCFSIGVSGIVAGNGNIILVSVSVCYCWC